MSPLLGLALALLVARVGANDVQPALAADQFTVFADTFDAGPDFHGEPHPPAVRKLHKPLLYQDIKVEQGGKRMVLRLIGGHNQDTFLGERQGVFDVNAGQAVASDHGPLVGQGADVGLAHVHHRLDSQD